MGHLATVRDPGSLPSHQGEWLQGKWDNGTMFYNGQKCFTDHKAPVLRPSLQMIKWLVIDWGVFVHICIHISTQTYLLFMAVHVFKIFFKCYELRKINDYSHCVLPAL